MELPVLYEGVTCLLQLDDNSQSIGAGNKDANCSCSATALVVVDGTS